jgi:OOP family OmpA-OmpF porin
VPASYAKVADSTIKFNKDSIAYEPVNYHAVFTSYGLELSPEEVGAKLGAINYAKVVDGKIVFAKGSIAYSGDEMATILSAYNLPGTAVAEAVPVQSAPVDTDKDGVPDAQDKCPGTPAGAVIDERGCWVLSASYLFDFDKAVIRTEYYPLLDDVVKIMNDNPTLTIEIQGHACNIGTDAYNQGLSERRANAVRDYLTKKNVDALRITTVGFGEKKPAHSNDNEEGRAKNRRIEFMPIW